MNKKIKVFLNSSDEELKEFGLLLAVAIPLIFGIILPWLFNKPHLNTSWLAGWVAAAVALVRPQVLKVVYVPWMMLADLLSVINRWAILSVVFYLVITPIALGRKWLVKKDALERKLNKNTPSYKKYSDNRRMSFTIPY